MVGIMMPIPDFAAYSVKKAVRGLGTNEETLIEIICTATNVELTAIKEAYKRRESTNPMNGGGTKAIRHEAY